MKRFADLYEALDSTTSTLAKVAAMAATSARPRRGRGLGAVVPHRPAAEAAPRRRALVGWTLELTGTPDWLFGESTRWWGTWPSHRPAPRPVRRPGDRIRRRCRCRSGWSSGSSPPRSGRRRAARAGHRVVGAADRRELFLLNKLLTGELRVGVSETLVVRALAAGGGAASGRVAQRLMGTGRPRREFFER